MNQTKKPRIIVSGHTSAGKTTIIRTLIKRPVGEIGARANITQTVKAEHHDDLQAEFIDSPGFQNAGKLSTYIEFGKDPNKDETLKYDVLASQALRNADAMLYVADLSIAPDSSHLDEIRFVTASQRNAIAVLNKCGEKRLLVDKDTLERERAWKDGLLTNGIRAVVSFDAHFDNPSRVNEIYNAIPAGFASGESRYF